MVSCTRLITKIHDNTKSMRDFDKLSSQVYDYKVFRHTKLGRGIIHARCRGCIAVYDVLHTIRTFGRKLKS